MFILIWLWGPGFLSLSLIVWLSFVDLQSCSVSVWVCVWKTTFIFAQQLINHTNLLLFVIFLAGWLTAWIVRFRLFYEEIHSGVQNWKFIGFSAYIIVVSGGNNAASNASKKSVRARSALANRHFVSVCFFSLLVMKCSVIIFARICDSAKRQKMACYPKYCTDRHLTKYARTKNKTESVTDSKRSIISSFEC